MNPTAINEDYLILRIGRLTINLEAALSQRNEAQALATQRERRIEELEGRVAELEELVKLIEDDEDDESEDDESED